MNLEVDETGPVERRMRIEIPTAEVDAAFDVAYRQLGRSARIRGFRPGRVPRSVLEQYYGEQARDDVLQRLVRESLPKAIEEAELALAGEPELEPPEKPRLGAPFRYEAKLEVRPTIELKRIRGLNVRVPELPTPERDPVEAHLEELRIAQAQQIEEPEGTVAARGHLAVIQYQARSAGEAVDGESAPREITVELGSDRSFPGLEEQLEGMVVGQQRSFELPAPGAPELAGEAEKRIAFEVRLVGLRRRELAELDDEFAKDVSELETLEALRADLARRVEEGREAERKRLLREATIDAVTEANPFPLPNGMVERQLTGRIARAVSQFRGQLPPEELAKRVERWRTEWRAQAERDVQLALLVPEIAKAEQLRVSPEDIEAQLGKLAEEQGTSADVLRQRFTDQGLLDALEGGLLEQRVVEFLGSQATLLES